MAEEVNRCFASIAPLLNPGITDRELKQKLFERFGYDARGLTGKGRGCIGVLLW